MAGDGAAKRRKSVFYETGLFDNTAADAQILPTPRPPVVRFRSKDEVHLVEPYLINGGEAVIMSKDSSDLPPLLSPLASRGRTSSSPPQQHHHHRLSVNESPLPEGTRSIMYRYAALLLVIVAALPFMQSNWLTGHSSALPITGVSGGPIPSSGDVARSEHFIDSRDDSPTHVCFRWSQQSALVNGTIYLYGGEATTTYTQTENTWNNNFLSLDLTSSWQIDSTPLKGLPQPSGPPAVALGYLWNSYHSLYLYGGEVSWKPPVEPPPFSLWEYDIFAETWIEHSNPLTSSGTNAPSNGVPVQRSAEGAGANVPSLGRGFYFGGHEDGYTTNGWSQSTPRIYLQSLLEFTFPGYSNSQVDALKNGQDAGDGGVYRNVSVGGLQADSGFTARADGLLIYVPGFGEQGILLALAGGTNETFTQMNEINVYDIATSSWYTQSTSGSTPEIRVNPCAVAVAAADGSSTNIYMFGGQNLIPYGNQTQFQDMWILTIPAFTWIKVDQSGQSIPYGGTGATCNVWDAQMIMIGGYVGPDELTCESPGVYVFDLSTLQWVGQFTSLSSGADDSNSTAMPTPQPEGFDSNSANNPFNQQPAQIPNGMQGSYGYSVPEIVYKVIGGDGSGKATVTKPITIPAGGPFSTGTAQTYTVTSTTGGSTATTTSTQSPGGGNSPSVSSSSGGTSSSSGKIAAIVVGSICGVLLILSAYLLFCLYIYRKQLRLYQHHVEMSQRQARGEKLHRNIPGLYAQGANESWVANSERQFVATTGGEGYSFLNNTNTNNNNNLSTDYDSGRSGSHAVRDSSSGPAGSGGRNGYQSLGGGGRASMGSSTEDLLSGQEPTFVGVMLHPRRSLKIVNRD